MPGERGKADFALGKVVDQSQRPLHTPIDLPRRWQLPPQGIYDLVARAAG